MIKVTIHSAGDGLCSLTGKDAAGLTISFEDGTVKESFLSWKGFQQLLAMKAGRKAERPQALSAAAIAPK